MSRQTQEMQPPRLDETVLRDLEKYADIKMPGECDEPILAPTVRAALWEWMIEIAGGSELKAANVKPRHTALLYGPPGCGKTTFAHHFAARLGLPLLLVRTEEMVGSFLGETPKRFAELFRILDAHYDAGQRYVVFIDEIDSIGTSRSSGQACDTEMARALNVMLRWVEGYLGVVMSATNRHDEIDPALWRRFDMQIKIELPGEDERFAILRRYLAPYDLPDGDLDVLVELTYGASPALLKNLMEGVKRALILWPKMKRDTSDPVAIVQTIAASIAPPPEIEKPPLWNGAIRTRDGAELSGLHWPPRCGGAS